MEAWLSTTAGIPAPRVTAVAKALDSQGFNDPQDLAELDIEDKLALFAAVENVVNVGERAKLKKALAVSGGERGKARSRSLSPAANPATVPDGQSLMSCVQMVMIIGLVAGLGCEFMIRSHREDLRLENTGVFANFHREIPAKIAFLQKLREGIFVVLLLVLAWNACGMKVRHVLYFMKWCIIYSIPIIIIGYHMPHLHVS